MDTANVQSSDSILTGDEENAISFCVLYLGAKSPALRQAANDLYSQKVGDYSAENFLLVDIMCRVFEVAFETLRVTDSEKQGFIEITPDGPSAKVLSQIVTQVEVKGISKE